MYKKMGGILLFILVAIVLIMPINSYAESNILYSKNNKQTEQFLVSIARPACNESTFKKVFKICGSTEKENVRIKLLILNKATNTYRTIENTQGESSWDVGSSGIFMKEIILPTEGINTIRICAYDKSEEEHLKLGENLQINEFNVTLLSKTLRDTVTGGFFRISDMFNRFF